MAQSRPAGRQLLFSILSLLITLIVAFGLGEALIRLKNASMQNYDIEMWRYAKELKVRSADPRLGFEHAPDSQATLESVLVRINSWGLRGGPVTDKPLPGVRRILLLGNSIAFGWGVPEDETLSALLQNRFTDAGQHVEVLNAGIGNYNAERYVERFLLRLAPLEPSDILVLAFARDGEELDSGGGNFLLRHSELAVTIWIASHRLFDPSGEKNLTDHYRAVYASGSRSLAVLQAEYAKLADYAKAHGIRVTVAMMPDIHNLSDYPLGFVGDTFVAMCRQLGFTYVDLLPAFKGRRPDEVWAMPGDPHPNALGHAIMAKTIFPVLAADAQAPGSSN
ncbi:MAG TPA: GDSL-type esterase/lipase family protein [Dongiaceae bacterium]|jgi:lysophospholipase L1-like esterase